jgi:5-methylcytosine-specific restriction endonuclease McrA
MTTIERMTPEEFQKAREKAIKELTRRQVYYQKNRVRIRANQNAYEEDRKEVRAVHNQSYYHLKKEEILEKQRLRRLTRKKEISEYNRKYRLSHKEQIRIYMQVYSLEYNLKNKEKIASQHRSRYLENREHILAQQQQQYREHPEAQQINHVLRRARMFEALGFFTKKDFRLKCEICDNVCVYCGEEKRLGPDHVIPLARGGSNYIENILPACKQCNCTKGTKTFEEFLSSHTQEEQEEILTRVYLLDHPEERLKENNGDS